jgi:hypothetical protein
MCLLSRVLDLTGPGFTPSLGLRLQTPVLLHSARQNTASKRELGLAAILQHFILYNNKKKDNRKSAVSGNLLRNDWLKICRLDTKSNS